MKLEDKAKIGRASYYIGRILFELGELEKEYPDIDRQGARVNEALWRARELRENLNSIARENDIRAY